MYISFARLCVKETNTTKMIENVCNQIKKKLKSSCNYIDIVLAKHNTLHVIYSNLFFMRIDPHQHIPRDILSWLLRS